MSSCNLQYHCNVLKYHQLYEILYYFCHFADGRCFLINCENSDYSEYATLKRKLETYFQVHFNFLLSCEVELYFTICRLQLPRSSIILVIKLCVSYLIYNYYLNICSVGKTSWAYGDSMPAQLRGKFTYLPDLLFHLNFPQLPPKHNKNYMYLASWRPM